jgi:hypothetical protein
MDVKRYKAGTLKGELTTAEIRKLIRAHNKASSIKIPPKSSREDIIGILKNAGYSVNHEKAELRPASKGKVQKLKVISQKTIAEELPKPKPLTEEQKKQRQQAKQKKAGEKAFLTAVIPKPPSVSKPSKGVKVKKPVQPNKEAPAPKPLPKEKKQAPKKPKKQFEIDEEQLSFIQQKKKEIKESKEKKALASAKVTDADFIKRPAFKFILAQQRKIVEMIIQLQKKRLSGKLDEDIMEKQIEENWSKLRDEQAFTLNKKYNDDKLVVEYGQETERAESMTKKILKPLWDEANKLRLK